ncbi:hypothetical protein GOODEAATRI_018492 [Goodea atripinnis]|uniref:Uncharacterized protein n=1 Tax=Goodea atripinnis TaxID=208336 RepID=A0ABV0MT62_9TELE
MVFIMDSPLLTQKSNNKTPLGFRSGRLFLPITPLQVSLSFPTWVLKSPSRIMESLGEALSSNPDRDAKNAGYSALLPGPWAETTFIDLSPTCRRRDATLSSTGVNPNTRRLSWGATSKPSPPPLPAGHSRVEETPAPLEEMGSRAHAVRGGEPDYLFFLFGHRITSVLFSFRHRKFSFIHILSTCRLQKSEMTLYVL